jgi:hypothetical protein
VLAPASGGFDVAAQVTQLLRTVVKKGRKTVEVATRAPRDGITALPGISLLRLDGHANIAPANRHHARSGRSSNFRPCKRPCHVPVRGLNTLCTARAVPDRVPGRMTSHHQVPSKPIMSVTGKIIFTSQFTRQHQTQWQLIQKGTVIQRRRHKVRRISTPGV